MRELLTASHAAEILGVDKRSVLRFVRDGRLRSYRTPGGQHRFRREDLERLTAGNVSSSHAAVSTIQNKRDEIEALNLEVQARRAKRELDRIEAEDAECEREQVEARRQAEREAAHAELECKEKKRQERAERKERAARESLAKQRRAWENEQIEFALRSLPRSDFSQAKQAVVHAIRDALKGIEPNDPASTISCAVDSAVQSVLAPIRREQAIERAIMESFGELPFEIRKIRLFSLSDAPLTEWEARAFRQAREAISGLSLNATAVEIRAAASQGVKRVAQQYANEKNESSHRRAIESMLNRVNGDKEKIAVREALDRLPVGCASVELQRAFDAVLTPIRERAKAAEETKRKEMKAEWDAERCLWRVREYIEELARDGDCNLNFWDRFQLAEKIKNRIRPRLIQHVLRGEADDGFARELIEEAVDAEL